MKKFKTMISVMLAFAMVMSVCAVQAPSVTTQAKVKIIAGKKLDMAVGKKETIVVKGKAKAKSSSKKVAKITKTKKRGRYTAITVKGMKVGKATIKIKGKGSKKVKVTIRPKNVTGVSARATNNSATIRWSKAKGASGYYVYRSNKSTGGFKKIATVKGTSYVNNGLALGAYYYYNVKAYGKKKITSEKASATRYAKTWKLTWQDEFEGNALDTSKWNNNGATGAGGYGNQELQNYQMDYCEVSNGKLVIKPQFNYDTSTNKCVPASYYSTKLWTKNQHTFTYGKIEFRAKMPRGKGTWAAGWMLGTGAGGNWADCGEIDVFETTKEATKTIIPQSLHMKKFHGGGGAAANKFWNTTVSTATSEFHTYAVEWYPTFIRFTVDGKEAGIYDPNVYSTNPKDSIEESHQLVDPTKIIKNDGTQNFAIWPYCKPFYLIMNCAIGGTLGGNVDPTYWTKIASSGGIDTYQDRLEFDYVRVYQ